MLKNLLTKLFKSKSINTPVEDDACGCGGCGCCGDSAETESCGCCGTEENDTCCVEGEECECCKDGEQEGCCKEEGECQCGNADAKEHTHACACNTEKTAEHAGCGCC